MALKFEDDGVHKSYEVEQTEEIIVFSKENCSYCMYIDRLLNQLNLEYTKLTLGEDFTKSEFYKKFGMDSTFPRVEINEELIGGARDTVEWLKQARYLPGH
jgi:glutaredoxin